MTHTSSLHAWIDASAGVAGDMLLAALVDAGADIIAVQAAVDQVIPHAVRLSATTVNRAGMRATKVDVTVLVDDPPHRTWRNIQTMLSASELPDRIRDDALAVFTRLANAEGHVHGIDAQDVHFHEVGALDSLADVIGVCAALHQLGISAISVSPIAVGSGRVKAAHGHIPVPVPAVTQLAKGWQIHAGGEGELTTPTGMALVTTLASSSTELPPMTLHSAGSGAGTKDTPGRPNITRVLIGEPTSRHHDSASTAVVLETNVDDLDPRLWPGVLARLLSDGASDAWLTPILMKKGRPAHTLKVLCRPDLADGLRQVIYAETTTLGIRQHTVRKHAALRGFAEIDSQRRHCRDQTGPPRRTDRAGHTGIRRHRPGGQTTADPPSGKSWTKRKPRRPRSPASSREGRTPSHIHLDPAMIIRRIVAREPFTARNGRTRSTDPRRLLATNLHMGDLMSSQRRPPPHISDRYADLLRTAVRTTTPSHHSQLTIGFYEGWRPSRAEMAELVAAELGISPSMSYSMRNAAENGDNPDRTSLNTSSPSRSPSPKVSTPTGGVSGDRQL